MGLMYDEGVDGVGSTHDEDQSGCSTENIIPVGARHFHCAEVFSFFFFEPSFKKHSVSIGGSANGMCSVNPEWTQHSAFPNQKRQF